MDCKESTKIHVRLQSSSSSFFANGDYVSTKIHVRLQSSSSSFFANGDYVRFDSEILCHSTFFVNLHTITQLQELVFACSPLSLIWVASLALALALRHLPSFTSLNVCGSGLTVESAGVLASGLSSMRSLTRLDLPFNGVLSVGIMSLAPSLEQSQSLRLLNLSRV